MKVWVPPGARPKWKCDICGGKFYRNERVKREKHVAQCASDHHDELVAAHHKRRPPAFYQPFDPEHHEHITRGQRRH